MSARTRFIVQAAGLLAVALATSTLVVHPDINFIAYASHYVAEGRLNVYQAAWEGPARGLVEGFTYPPLTYLVFGAWIALGKVFGLFGYAEWNGPLLMSRAEYLYLRLWFTPFVLLVAWTLRRLSEEFILTPEQRADGATGRAIFLLGLSSPVVLFSTYAFGQFDVLPASLLFLGLYLLAGGRVFWGVQALFVGAWLKNFPVLFLVLALPVLLAEFGWRRVAVAVGTGLAASWAWMRAFRSEGFTHGFLAFRHHDYDVLFFSGHAVRAALSNYLLAGVLLLSVGLALFRTPLARWEKLALVYATGLVALLAPRFWMPQYVSWVAPVFLLLVVLWLGSRSPVGPAVHVGFGAVYLLAVTALFASNVDSPMFRWLFEPGHRVLADVIKVRERRSELWTAVSAALFTCGAMVSARLLVGERLWRRLEPVRPWSPALQLRAAWMGGLAVYLAFIALHVGSLLVERTR